MILKYLFHPEHDDKLYQPSSLKYSIQTLKHFIKCKGKCLEMFTKILDAKDQNSNVICSLAEIKINLKKFYI